MAWTAEQQRQKRAEKRAADEAKGIFRRKQGRAPTGHIWDQSTGDYVPEKKKGPKRPSAGGIIIAGVTL